MKHETRSMKHETKNASDNVSNTKFQVSSFKFHAKKGFTLVELLVVITIIGILTTVAVTSYTSQQKRGRDGQRKFDLKSVQASLEQYYVSQTTQQYPGGSGVGYTQMTTTLQTAKYLKIIPQETLGSPQPAYYYLGLKVDGTACAGGAAGDCQDYLLCAKLENSKDPHVSPQSTNYVCTGQTGTYNYFVKAQ